MYHEYMIEKIKKYIGVYPAPFLGSGFRSTPSKPCVTKLNNKGRRLPNGAGFTLIELLVVIATISGLAGLLVANFVGIRQRGRDAQRKSELRQIQSALELYRSDNGIYPLTAAFPTCPNQFVGTGPTPPVYMQKIPCDPLQNTSYTYSSTDGRTYTIYACLENTNDSNRDANDATAGDRCTTSGVVSYTLTNP